MNSGDASVYRLGKLCFDHESRDQGYVYTGAVLDPSNPTGFSKTCPLSSLFLDDLGRPLPVRSFDLLYQLQDAIHLWIRRPRSWAERIRIHTQGADG